MAPPYVKRQAQSSPESCYDSTFDRSNPTIWRRSLSPILVRPVREQLEHDRLIRLLHAKFRRRYEAAMNPGAEPHAAVGGGPTALYPDILLMSPDRGHKLQIVVEVETGESV